MIVCRDCHDVITWYQDQAIPKFKNALAKAKHPKRITTKKTKSKK